MSALYIPPQGIYFRLLGNASQNVLFSRTSPEPQVGQTPTQAESDIQFFTLVYGTGERDGTYAIKSKATGNVLFSRASPNPRVGHSSGDAQRSDKSVFPYCVDLEIGLTRITSTAGSRSNWEVINT